MPAYGNRPRSYGTGAYGAPKPIRMAPSTSGSVTPLGISTRAAPKPAFSQDQVNKSLAANPQATMGPSPRVNYQQQRPQADPGVPKTADLSYDYSADPILNQINALSSRQRGDAQSEALKLRKQLAIDYGDEALGGSLDQGTGQAAAGNPFSVRAQLKKGYDTGVGELEEQYNDQNLFYGGARAKGLGDFANQYQGQLAGAAGQQQNMLDEITRNLAAALMGADERDILAQQGAQGEALGGALEAGIDPGAAPPLAAVNPNLSIPGVGAANVGGSAITRALTSMASHPAATTTANQWIAPPKKKNLLQQAMSQYGGL